MDNYNKESLFLLKRKVKKNDLFFQLAVSTRSTEVSIGRASPLIHGISLSASDFFGCNSISIDKNKNIESKNKTVYFFSCIKLENRTQSNRDAFLFFWFTFNFLSYRFLKSDYLHEEHHVDFHFHSLDLDIFCDCMK